MNSRVIIPSELRPDTLPAGTYIVEGRLTFEEDDSATVHVEKLTPVSEAEEGGPNIHDHRGVNKASGGRHDHEPPPWGANHRHIGTIRSRPVPPIVVGCLGVDHDQIDCFAAGKPDKELCRVCERALGRPL